MKPNVYKDFKQVSKEKQDYALELVADMYVEQIQHTTFPDIAPAKSFVTYNKLNKTNRIKVDDLDFVCKNIANRPDVMLTYPSLIAAVNENKYENHNMFVKAINNMHTEAVKYYGKTRASDYNKSDAKINARIIAIKNKHNITDAKSVNKLKQKTVKHAYNALLSDILVASIEMFIPYPTFKSYFNERNNNFVIITHSKRLTDDEVKALLTLYYVNNVAEPYIQDLYYQNATTLKHLIKGDTETYNNLFVKYYNELKGDTENKLVPHLVRQIDKYNRKLIKNESKTKQTTLDI